MLSVTEKGQPVADGIKLQRLRQILLQLIDDSNDGLVNIKKARLYLCRCLLCMCQDRRALATDLASSSDAHNSVKLMACCLLFDRCVPLEAPAGACGM